MVRGWTGRQLSAKPGSGWVQEAQDKTAMLLGFLLSGGGMNQPKMEVLPDQWTMF